MKQFFTTFLDWAWWMSQPEDFLVDIYLPAPILNTWQFTTWDSLSVGWIEMKFGD